MAQTAHLAWRQFLDLTGKAPWQAPVEAVNLARAIVALDALSRACTQVASLRRRQKAFDEEKSRDALERTLAEVMREFDLR